MNNETETKCGLSLNYDALSSGLGVPKQPEPEVVNPPVKRRGRPPKKVEETGMEIQENTSPNSNLFSVNTPYMDSYKETMTQCDYIASQADTLVKELKVQLDTIKNNKLLKNKYMHINDCASAINSLLSTELQCVREKNKTVADCHNFEMKRAQAQKAAAAAVPDNKYIADLYQAYINMPTAQQIPNNPLNMTSAHAVNNPAYQFNPIMDDTADFANFHNNITPEQNRMILGDNPNIETVVCFNEATDEKYFMVIDNITNQPVPNYPLPDPMMLQGADINKMTMTVSNSNFGEQWRLILVTPGVAY